MGFGSIENHISHLQSRTLCMYVENHSHQLHHHDVPMVDCLQSRIFECVAWSVYLNASGCMPLLIQCTWFKFQISEIFFIVMYIQVLWHATVISMNLIRFEIWIFLSTSCYVRFYVWMWPFLWLVYMSVSKRACVRISISREKPLHTCLYDCTHLFLCPYFARTSGYGFYNSIFKFQK